MWFFILQGLVLFIANHAISAFNNAASKFICNFHSPNHQRNATIHLNFSSESRRIYLVLSIEMIALLEDSKSSIAVFFILITEIPFIVFF